MVQGAGCRVQGAGCRVQGPGPRVQTGRTSRQAQPSPPGLEYRGSSLRRESLARRGASRHFLFWQIFFLLGQRDFNRTAGPWKHQPTESFSKVTGWQYKPSQWLLFPVLWRAREVRGFSWFGGGVSDGRVARKYGPVTMLPDPPPSSFSRFWPVGEGAV